MSLVIEEVSDDEIQPASSSMANNPTHSAELEEDFFDVGEASSDDEWQDMTDHFDASTLATDETCGAAAWSAAPGACSSRDIPGADGKDMAAAPAMAATGKNISPTATETPSQNDSATQSQAERQSSALPSPVDEAWENSSYDPHRSNEFGIEPRAAIDAAEDRSYAAAGQDVRPSGDAENPEVLSAEEFEARVADADALKAEGNQLFAAKEWQQAQVKYGEALDRAPATAPQRAVYFANRAACALKLRQWSDATADCTSAIAVDPGYVKAFLRRATAYEEADDLERSLADYSKVCELDPGNAGARAKATKLQPIVEARREKMKEEMIGKLKDLGNTVLGKFGMSLDNFKATKGPDGGYSLSFQQ